MTVRTIRLSGFKSADIVNKISIDDRILTSTAVDITNDGVLCWSGVRKLDDLFRKSLATDAGARAYIREISTSTGRHLFSILTGRKIFDDGIGIDFAKFGNVKITGGYKSSRILLTGNMSLPNFIECASSRGFEKSALYGMQIDPKSSEYGAFFFENGEWDLHKKLNGKFSVKPLSAELFFSAARRLLYNSTTLCSQDMQDMYAECILDIWASKWYAAFSVTNNTNGMSFSFPKSVPTFPKMFFRFGNQFALNYARSNLISFSSNFGLSPGYSPENQSFPNLP